MEMEETVLPARERREGSEAEAERTVEAVEVRGWMKVEPESLMAYSLVRERRPAAQPTSSSSGVC